MLYFIKVSLHVSRWQLKACHISLQSSQIGGKYDIWNICIASLYRFQILVFWNSVFDWYNISSRAFHNWKMFISRIISCRNIKRDPLGTWHAYGSKTFLPTYINGKWFISKGFIKYKMILFIESLWVYLSIQYIENNIQYNRQTQTSCIHWEKYSHSANEPIDTLIH